ncbi:hypothetical protein CSUI_003247 [Cystoisospora suis]|uniref:Aspartyl/Glutamyl-tRNA(Gln) amidotransferase subunit B/E catalytic domain-containing protein n=1 Tax=Cystoisospora suis TaxID=483139 RepID=A0A2C6L5N6_9APIC|nr:hypothetical protein CSUI_003247 [Cystoisospora suis]
MDMPPSPGKLFISLFFCSVLASPATCALVTAWESRSLSTPSPSPSRYAFSPGSPSPVLYSPLTLSSSSSRLLSSLLPPRSWGLSASHPLSDTSATLTFGSPPSRSSSPSLRLTGLFFSGDSIRDLLMCWSPEASSSLAPSRGCLCFSHWHGPRPLYTPAGRKSNPGMVTHRTRSIADFTGDRFVHHHHSCKEESRVSVSLHHFPFRRSNASTSRDNLAKPWKALFAYLLHTTGPYRSYCGKGDERSSYRQTPRFSLLHTMGHKKSVEVFASVPTLSRETTRKKGACDTDQTSEGKEGNERHHQCKIDVETVIGVEAHVQLLTASKLFCACPSQLMFTCAARRIAPRHTSSRIDRLVQGCLSRADANPGSTQAANKLADQDRNMGAHAGHQGDLGQSRGEQVAGGSVKGRVTGEAVRSGTHTGRSEARACNASTDDDRRHTDGQRERHEVLEATDQCVQRSTSQGLTHWLPFPLSPKCILRPNIFICPTCLGEPGSLPSPSREAVETALKAAMLLQCEDIRESRAPAPSPESLREFGCPRV